MKIRNMIAVFLVLLSSWCASILIRSTSPEDVKGLYLPTRTEADTIYNGLWFNGQVDGLWILSIPLMIDLPLTATADTLMIPYDLIFHNKTEESK